ncbi:hypothetical protein ETN89_19730 (plasmid) [Photobacterium damselae subsp. damselae]|uniref:hypothetical protein n=1 Tax=Photobacterium damselae TaxID=38293 RepID=UPI000A2FF5D3|nr:hypothetical protein [Photobacterium damselae]ARR51814.1 hypothetical protein CAY62_20580 [Photobacterium damselae subsp. damselae]QAY37499.1 hypothetical protein ETN89_19730 [Photobacterium damselae subsp. damselae]
MTLPQKIPHSMKEAYYQEMMIEIIAAKKELTELEQQFAKAMEDNSIRLGMTYELSENCLKEAQATFNQYINAANAHFTATKGEVEKQAYKKIEDTVTRSLIQSHKQLMVANPPKMTLGTILGAIGVSTLIAAIVGIGFGLGAYQLSEHNRFTAQEIQLLQKGVALQKAWPSLSSKTQKELSQAMQ